MQAESKRMDWERITTDDYERDAGRDITNWLLHVKTEQDFQAFENVLPRLPDATLRKLRRRARHVNRLTEPASAKTFQACNTMWSMGILSSILNRKHCLLRINVSRIERPRE